MKRRWWFGVMLMAWAIFAPLLSYAPAVEALGCSTLDPCSTLTVNLNNPLAAGGKIVVTREGTDKGLPDQSFQLTGSGKSFSSGGKIGGTQPALPPCTNTGANANQKLFTITITDAAGKVLQTAGDVNLCNPDPIDSKAITKAMTIAAVGAPVTTGMISGHIEFISEAQQVKDPKNPYVKCPSGTQINITNNATGAATTTTIKNANGDFGPLGNLAPGTYTVQGACVDSSGKGTQIQRNNVVIKAGETTAVTINAGNPSDKSSATPTGNGGGDPVDEVTDCDAGPGFTWIICGIIKLVIGVVDEIRNAVILPALEEPPVNKNEPQFAGAYKIWQVFRNIASVFFILVFFFVIVGTALGLDNYSIKKILPRLVAGAILMPFSWYICAFMVDIGNVFGRGIVDIVANAGIKPNLDFTSSWSSFFGLTTLGVAAGAAGWALVGAATTAGLGAAISILIAFVGVFATLIMRKILIILWIVISPFALLAWILPNTEKYFKMWRENGTKLIAMFPIIMGLFEAGRLLSAAAGTTTSWTSSIFAVGGIIAPLFAIPWAFKLAGNGLSMGSGAVSRLTGAADKRFGKDSDMAKERADNRVRNSVERAKLAESAAAESSGFGKFYQGRKASMNWRRAGLGSSTLPGREVNDSMKLKRSAATGKAAEEKGQIIGEARQSAESKLPGNEHMRENFGNRVEAMGELSYQKKTEERGNRQGVLEGRDSAGGGSRGSEWTEAARIKARDNYMGGVQDAQGLIEANNLNERARRTGAANYVSNDTKMQAGRTRAAESASQKMKLDLGTVNGTENVEAQITAELVAGGMSQADAEVRARGIRLNTLGDAKANHESEHISAGFGEAKGNVEGNKELDQEMKDHQAHVGNTVTLEEARQMRMHNVASNSFIKTREALGTEEGEIDQRLATSAAAGGKESMKQLVEAGGLAAREQYSSQRALREKRVEAQNMVGGEGSLDHVEAMDAARIEARNRVATGVSAQKQALEQEEEDERRFREDGDAAARPTMRNEVLAAREGAKAKTTAASADRIANARASIDGRVATTEELTEGALYASTRSVAERNSKGRATAATVRAQIDARQRQMAGGGPLTPQNRKNAVISVRNENVNAISNKSEQGALIDTQKQINEDIGAGAEIDAEVQARAAELISSGVNPVDAVTRAKADFNARTLASVGVTSRGAGGIESREQREGYVGKAENRAADEAAERELIRAEPGGGTLTNAQVNARATARVTQHGLETAGAAAREAGAQADREAGGKKGGIADDIEARTDEELAKNPGAYTGTPAERRAAAAATARRTALEGIGTKAEIDSRNQNRAKTAEGGGAKSDLDKKIKAVQDANPTMSPADAEKQVVADELAGIQAVSYDAGAKKYRTDSANISGAASDIKEKVDAELAKNPGAYTGTPAEQRAAAADSVLGSELGDIDVAASDAAAKKARLETAATAGTARSINTEVDNDLRSRGIDPKSAAGAAARAASEESVRNKRLRATGKVASEAGAKKDTVDTAATEETANSIDERTERRLGKLTQDYNNKVAKGEIDPSLTPAPSREDAYDDMLTDAGVQAGLDAGKRDTDTASDAEGVRDNFDDDVKKEIASGTSAAAAAGQVRGKRLNERAKVKTDESRRKANKEVSDDAGGAQGLDQDREKRRNEKRTELDKAMGKVASRANYTDYDLAQDAERDLQAATSNKAREEAADKITRELDDTLANEDVRDSEIGDEYDEQLASYDEGVANGSIDPTKVARPEGNAGREQARRNREAKNIDKASKAARIAGQKTRANRTAKDQGVIDANDAAKKQAPVEQRRNAAGKTTFEASQQKAADDALQKAIDDARDAGRAAPTPDEAKAIQDAARESNLADALLESKNAANAAGEAAAEDIRTGKITDTQQQRALIQNLGTATREQTMRQEDTAAALTNAYVQAATASGALNPEERLAAQTEAAVDSLAAESAQTRARYNKTRPGQKLNRTFQAAESSMTKNEESKILSSRTDEAQKKEMAVDMEVKEQAYKLLEENGNPVPQPELDGDGNEIPGTQQRDEHGAPVFKRDIDPSTGQPIPVKNDDGTLKRDPVYEWTTDPVTGAPVRAVDENGDPKVKKRTVRDQLGSMDINQDSIPVLKARAEELARNGEDDAELVAIMDNMSKTNAGTMAVQDMQEKIFGGNYDQTIDPASLGGRGREIWQQLQARRPVTSKPFYTIPPAALYDGFSPEDFAKLGYAGKKQYFQFLRDTKNPALYDEAAQNIHSALTNPQVARGLNADDYQYMYVFMQDPAAQAAMAKITSNKENEQGTDIMAQIHERGKKYGADNRFTYDEADAYNEWANAQNNSGGFAPGQTGYIEPKIKAGEKYTRAFELDASDNPIIPVGSDGRPIFDRNHDNLGDFLSGSGTIPSKVGGAFIEATGDNAEHAAALMREYVDAANAAAPTTEQQTFKDYVEQQIRNGEKVDLTRTPLPTAPTTTTPVQKAVYKKIRDKFKNDAETIRKIVDAYNTNPEYKASVDKATLGEDDIPRPPAA